MPKELYGLVVLMMVESFFVLLCKFLDFARHDVHFQAMLIYGALQYCSKE
jgi:hypothetical protein